MVPPSVQSHTMVDNNMPRRDPNAMDVDTHQAMVDMGYAVDVIVDPPDMGYGNPDMGYEEAAPDMGYEEAAPDMGYEEAAPTIGEMGYGDDNATDDADMGYEETAIDLGYEPAAPSVAAAAPRRGSMSANEQTQRRASIKAIMADPAISPMAKRRSIHHLMDGRRQSLTGGTNLPQSGNKSMHNPYAAPDLSEGDRHCTSTSQGHFIANEQTKIAEEKRPVCTHYDRKCTLIAPCCGAAFGCRICHDECAVLPPKINNGSKRYHRSASLPSSFTSMETSQPEDTHHNIDRFAVREVICRECFTRQSSKTDNCINCGVLFGDYHCHTCNLWMSNEEHPYHCEDCGFCRVGGKDNFQHCHSCGMCIDKSLYDNHNCKSGKYKSNCPVCQEYLFSSRSASHEMPCGHAIHWECFRQLAAHDSRCPVCKKTAETRERMMPTWNAMASGVAMQPVPAELCRVVNISCNDCERADDGRAWHFLGIQCMHCQSFNTVVDRIVLTGNEAHEYLEVNNRQEEAVVTPAPARRKMNRRRSAF